jgi:membrane associated rhomboid family serine protease
MDQGVMRALKLVVLAALAAVFVGAGVWLYLAVGLSVGLAGPVFAVMLLLYVVNDVYEVVAAA